MAFENVGPQSDRGEPWQAQLAKSTIRGLTDPSPWMRHQRRLLFGGLIGLSALIVLAIATTALVG